MHGLIFISFEQYLRRSGLDIGADGFADDQSYPDEELLALVNRAAERKGVSTADILREFGQFLGVEGFPSLVPAFYATHPDLASALLAVEDEIHERVRRTVPYALPPRLHATPLGDHGVVIAYTSERNVCPLLEGLIRGTAAYYGTPIELSEPQCMQRGETACSFVVQLVEPTG